MTSGRPKRHRPAGWCTSTARDASAGTVRAAVVRRWRVFRLDGHEVRSGLRGIVGRHAAFRAPAAELGVERLARHGGPTLTTELRECGEQPVEVLHEVPFTVRAARPKPRRVLGWLLAVPHLKRLEEGVLDVVTAVLRAGQLRSGPQNRLARIRDGRA